MHTGKRRFSLLLIPFFIILFGGVVSVILKQYSKQNHQLVQLKMADAAKDVVFAVKENMQQNFNVAQGIAYALANSTSMPGVPLQQYVSEVFIQTLNENRYVLSIQFNAEIPVLDSSTRISYKPINISAQRNDFGAIKTFFGDYNFLQTDPNELGSYQNIKNNPQKLLLNPVKAGVANVGNPINAITYIVPVSKKSTFIGVLSIRVSSQQFDNLLNAFYTGISGDVSVVAPNGMLCSSSNPVLLQSNVSDVYSDKISDAELLQTIVSGDKVINSYQSMESKQKHLVQFYPIKTSGNQAYWSIVSDVPEKNINTESGKSKTIIIFLSLLVIFLFSFAVVFVVKKIMDSIHTANNVLSKVAKGEISKDLKLNITIGEELKNLSFSVNALIDRLLNSAEFAKNIGHGNLSVDYKSVEENDVLGKALLEMRESLMRAKDDEEKRKETDYIQNWATEGEAKFGDILRKSNENIGQLSFMLLSNLIDYLGAIQGGLFVRDENEGEDMQFNLTGSIAFDREKLEERSFKVGEGLVGRCAYEKTTIYMEDVPDDYVFITSGLGEANPRSVLLIPAMLNDQVYAIIELISFGKFLPYQINFVERIGESVASTIATVKINHRTQSLLGQSKQQSEELAAQEEEMRQNLEELQATQEEIERLRAEDKMKNEMAMEEVNKNRKALLNVLDAMSNKIYLKDAEGRFVFANKKTLEGMGVSLDEIVGKSDLDLFDKKEATKYWNEEQKIIKSGQTYTRTYFNMVDGNSVVQETTKIPFYIDFMDQTGLLGFDIDISKLMDKEDQIQELKSKVKELAKALEGKE